MFDKTRERIARLEETNETFRKVKLHLETNKNAYISGAAGVGIGFALKKRPNVTEVINNVMPHIAPVFNNDNSSVVNFGGHMTKLVKCLETGEMWETVTEAAKHAGFPISVMSKHLNGHTEILDGLHYAIVGVGTSG